MDKPNGVKQRVFDVIALLGFMIFSTLLFCIVGTALKAAQAH